MSNQKKQGEGKGGVNPVVAAVTGAVVGVAAVGIAGAAVMANADSRKKVENAIAKGQEKVNEVATAVKNSTQNSVKDTK